MKTYSISLLIILLFIITSCDDTEDIVLKEFPEQPVNIDILNTSYDDLNETVTGFYYQYMTFLISSNKDSDGNNFDLYNYLLKVESSKTDDLFDFDLEETGYDYYNPIINEINSNYNEKAITIKRNSISNYDILFYSCDSSDNFDFYYSKSDIIMETWDEISPLSKINTTSNEIDLNVLDNELIYSSDVNGNYDIFRIQLTKDLSDWLDAEEEPIIEIYELLNSTADDRCVNVSGNYIYFSSNREGGYGGYDLYYSYYSNGEWSEPQNCGPNINSEFDELNPVTIYYADYKNDLLFYSSNRTGGKGGFDIYAVGIPKILLY